MRQLVSLLFSVCILYACETVETRQPEQRATLEAIPEVYDDETTPGARAATNGAYLCIKITRAVSTTATVATTTLAYKTVGVTQTGDLMADSVTTKKGFSKVTIKADRIGEYVKKKIDLTKSYHWYILHSDYKIYREVCYTGPNESVFPWIAYTRSALVIDGRDFPIVQSTKRLPLD